MKFTVVCLAIFAASVTLVAGAEDKIDALYRMVFGRAEIQPKKTEELLKEMSKIFSADPEGSYEGKNVVVGRILETGRVGADKCNQEFYDQLKSSSNFYSKNVANYLAPKIREQQEVCMDKFKTEFHNAVESTPADMRDNLKAMSEKFDEVDVDGRKRAEMLPEFVSPYWTSARLLNMKQRSFVPLKDSKYRNVSAGVLEYLATKESSLMKHLDTKWYPGRLSYLTSKFDEHVKPMCNTIVDALDPFKYIYEHELQLYESVAEVREYFKHRMHCDLAMFDPKETIHFMAELTKKSLLDEFFLLMREFD